MEKWILRIVAFGFIALAGVSCDHKVITVPTPPPPAQDNI